MIIEVRKAFKGFAFFHAERLGYGCCPLQGVKGRGQVGKKSARWVDTPDIGGEPYV